MNEENEEIFRLYNTLSSVFDEHLEINVKTLVLSDKSLYLLRVGSDGRFCDLLYSNVYSVENSEGREEYFFTNEKGSTPHGFGLMIECYNADYTLERIMEVVQECSEWPIYINKIDSEGNFVRSDIIDPIIPMGTQDW